MYVCIMSKFEENLIQAVQKQDVLYDRSNKNFRDSLSKKIAWIAVAKEMQEKVPICEKRWQNLRDQYRKYRKAIQTRRDFDKEPKFIFATQMKFMEDHVVLRSGHAGVREVYIKPEIEYHSEFSSLHESQQATTSSLDVTHSSVDNELLHSEHVMTMEEIVITTQTPGKGQEGEGEYFSPPTLKNMKDMLEYVEVCPKNEEVDISVMPGHLLRPSLVDTEDLEVSSVLTFMRARLGSIQDQKERRHIISKLLSYFLDITSGTKE